MTKKILIAFFSAMLIAGIGAGIFFYSLNKKAKDREAQAEQKFTENMALVPEAPAKVEAINDLAKVVKEPEKLADSLEIYKKAGIPVTIVTVDSMNGLNSMDYAQALVKKWKIADKDDHILVVIKPQTEKFEAQVGFDLGKDVDPALRTERFAGLVNDFMTPYIKSYQNYDGAVMELLHRLEPVLGKERAVEMAKK